MELTAEQRQQLEERLGELRRAREAFVMRANQEIAGYLAREDEIRRLLGVANAPVEPGSGDDESRA